jgi:hypothetical protein
MPWRTTSCMRRRRTVAKTHQEIMEILETVVHSVERRDAGYDPYRRARWSRPRGACSRASTARCAGWAAAPTCLLTDNERTLTSDRVAGVPVRHPELVAAGRHYSLKVETSVPYDPETRAVRKRRSAWPRPTWSPPRPTCSWPTPTSESSSPVPFKNHERRSEPAADDRACAQARPAGDWPEQARHDPSYDQDPSCLFAPHRVERSPAMVIR